MIEFWSNLFEYFINRESNWILYKITLLF